MSRTVRIAAILFILLFAACQTHSQSALASPFPGRQRVVPPNPETQLVCLSDDEFGFLFPGVRLDPGKELCLQRRLRTLLLEHRLREIYEALAMRRTA